MAKYFDAGISEVSFVADEDLSSYQWYLMMAASTSGYCQLHDIAPPGYLELSGCGRMPIGVLTNSPSLGQEATVKVIGFSKAKAAIGGCDLGHGALLCADGTGQFVAASQDKSDEVLGIWFGPNVTSGSAIGNVLLNMSFVGASGFQLLSENN